MSSSDRGAACGLVQRVCDPMVNMRRAAVVAAPAARLQFTDFRLLDVQVDRKAQGSCQPVVRGTKGVRRLEGSGGSCSQQSCCEGRLDENAILKLMCWLVDRTGVHQYSEGKRCLFEYGWGHY